MKILVIRIDGIGDNIMNIPFLRELRKNCSNDDIHILIRPQVYPLLNNCPYIDTIKIYWNEFPYKNQHQLEKNIKLIKDENYDLILCPRLAGDFGPPIILSHIPEVRSIGFRDQTKYLGHPKCGWGQLKPEDCLSEMITCTDPIHDVEANMRILDYLEFKYESCNLEYWSNPDHVLLDSITSEIKNDYIVASVACSDPSRRWSLENFINLIDDIQSNYDVWFAIVGGDDVRNIGRKLTLNTKYSKIINLTASLSLNELYEIIKSSKCFVGNDSCPMHLSAATGVPTIGLFRENLHCTEKEWYNSDIVRHYPYCDKSYAIPPIINGDINSIDFNLVSNTIKKIISA